MIDPIVIDDCLSPRLVGVAKRRGHELFHGVWIDRKGYPDWELAAPIAGSRRPFVGPPLPAGGR